MPRYRLLLEYDGRPYVGWQHQANGLSVQEVLENAIAAMIGERREVLAAGRTDAGVHAEGQVAHVDLPREMAPFAVQRAINAHLRPHPISVITAEPVPDDFHARFSCTRRHYRYRILNRSAPPAIDQGRVWHVWKRLDAAAMHAAAQALVGHHDFTSFRAAACQAKSAQKTLDFISVQRLGEEVVITTHARSFLHHQVRNMAGSLKLVGEGRWTARDIEQALAARDRSAAGPTAPPDGLTLVRVEY